MKAMKSFFDWRAYVAFVVFSVLVSVTVSCKPDALPPDPPTPPIPPVVIYTKPAVAIKPAEKVTMTTATIVAKVVPNENETSVSFEYKNVNTDWTTKALALTFNGKDSVSVTFDLSDLKAGTEYSFRVKASNKGGDITSSESKFETYAVSDFDGNLYHIVTIGTQTFTKENFRGTHYANGDAIANVIDPTTWSNLTTGAYCWYNNDSKIGEVYGGLYNFYVGNDSRGLIVGWHVPVGREFSTLRMFLDGYYPAGPALMESGSAHWKNPARPGNNSTGFSALPNGAFAPETGTGKWIFMNLGEDAVLWTSDPFGPGASPAQISIANCWFAIEYIYPQKLGFGLRLMKN